ncbi:hypothetical protein FO519_002162 [Halicephalobus sp. NKZ332]|nr:hypothetical protein FO519_002162 [Halicephalobus sp. NKZ332]
MAQAINHHAHHDEHKRVSFGAEEQVTKIIYDAAPDGYEGYNNVHTTRTTNSFTSPDAPPSKVRVTSEEKDIPRPISPPAQLEEVKTAVPTSPPLPSLVKRMEHHDHDNPFRPQEILYHEVDPIVEAYRNRPFPPSPAGSPIPHEMHASTTITTTKSSTPQNNSHHTVKETTTFQAHSYSSPIKHTSTPTHPGNVRADFLDKRHSGTPGGLESSQLLPGDIPPPNTAEVVHIEKKKKCCGCCSVQ